MNSTNTNEALGKFLCYPDNGKLLGNVLIYLDDTGEMRPMRLVNKHWLRVLDNTVIQEFRRLKKCIEYVKTKHPEKRNLLLLTDKTQIIAQPLITEVIRSIHKLKRYIFTALKDLNEKDLNILFKSYNMPTTCRHFHDLIRLYRKTAKYLPYSNTEDKKLLNISEHFIGIGSLDKALEIAMLIFNPLNRTIAFTKIQESSNDTLITLNCFDKAIESAFQIPIENPYLVEKYKCLISISKKLQKISTLFIEYNKLNMAIRFAEKIPIKSRKEADSINCLLIKLITKQNDQSTLEDLFNSTRDKNFQKIDSFLSISIKDLAQQGDIKKAKKLAMKISDLSKRKTTLQALNVATQNKYNDLLAGNSREKTNAFIRHLPISDCQTISQNYRNLAIDLITEGNFKNCYIAEDLLNEALMLIDNIPDVIMNHETLYDVLRIYNNKISKIKNIAAIGLEDKHFDFNFDDLADLNPEHLSFKEEETNYGQNSQFNTKKVKNLEPTAINAKKEQTQYQPDNILSLSKQEEKRKLNTNNQVDLEDCHFCVIQ
ncbi:MAG: hypothetical protein H0V82_04720 [Candidatus Protochlamydia sp.]|nr:hypothetical protein [Candidatus Protochlamydia sp.]